jgi:hypothetical protein
MKSSIGLGLLKSYNQIKVIEFNNLLLRGILDAAVVTQSISCAYHPMSQGSVDRFNGTMKAYLRKKVLGHQN